MPYTNKTEIYSPYGIIFRFLNNTFSARLSLRDKWEMGANKEK